MSYGLYLSAEGAQAQAKQLEVISNNLANINTPGFKRQLAIFQARYAEAIDQGLDTEGSETINDTSGGIVVDTSRTDFSQGPMKQTGVATDIAVVGDGFFMVDKNGEKLLTRAGNFHLDNNNKLLTEQGYPVLDQDGTPIVVDPAAGPDEIGRLVNRVAVVSPESLRDLQPIGENLFRASGATAPDSE